MIMDSMPAKMGLIFLKLNIFLFIATAGMSVIGIFPFQMQMTQVANNIALDVANRNYIEEEDLNNYVGYMGKVPGEEGYLPMSYFVYKEDPLSHAKMVERDGAEISELQGMADHLAVASDLDVGKEDFYIEDEGEAVAAVGVKTLDSDKNLIVDPVGDFAPLNKNEDIVRGMNGTDLGGGYLVNRGEPFEVVVKTRYRLTSGILGFVVNSGIPTEVSVVGVTTESYQTK